MSVSVILLAHNEAEVIQREIRAFHAAIIEKLPGSELVIAEDGSRDGTRERIAETSREIPLRLAGGSKERLGYTGAVVNALREVDSDWVCLCDSGLKHDPADFWKLWNAREGNDLILGYRTNRRDQRYRRFFTIAFNAFVRSFFHTGLRDSDTGLRLMRRPVVELIRKRGLSFRGFCSTEVVLRAQAAGFRCIEVPVSYAQRVGESRGLPLRSTGRVIVRVLGDLWRLRGELRQQRATTR